MHRTDARRQGYQRLLQSRLKPRRLPCILAGGPTKKRLATNVPRSARVPQHQELVLASHKPGKKKYPVTKCAAWMSANASGRLITEDDYPWDHKAYAPRMKKGSASTPTCQSCVEGGKTHAALAGSGTRKPNEPHWLLNAGRRIGKNGSRDGRRHINRPKHIGQH